MPRTRNRVAPLMAVLLLAVSGCSLSTEPVVFQDFQWIALENANQVVEGMDAAVFAGDVALLGQMKTPTLCFRLSGRLERGDKTLTVRVTAEPNNSQTCGNAPGGYQYTAAIRGLDSGEYTLNVVHAVSGATDKQYSKTLVIQ